MSNRHAFGDPRAVILDGEGNPADSGHPFPVALFPAPVAGGVGGGSNRHGFATLRAVILDGDGNPVDEAHPFPVTVAAGVAPAIVPGNYYIYQAGGTYYLWDLVNSALVTQGTDAGALANTASALLPSHTGGSTSASGGLILFGPGTFEVATTIVGDRTGLVFAGLGGGGATKLHQAASYGAGRAMFEFGTSGGNAGTLQNLEIRDLTLYGKQNDGAITDGRGINIWASHCRVLRCTVRNWNEHAVYIAGTASGTAYMNEIRYNDIAAWGRTGVYTANGITLETGASDTYITDNWVQGSPNGTPVHDVGGCGIYVHAGAVSMSNNHVWFCVGQNAPYGSHYAGIKLNGAGNVEMVNNLVESNNANGIYAVSSNNITISQGQVYANDRSADASNSYADIETYAVSRLFISGVKMTKAIPEAPNIYRKIVLQNSQYCDVGDVLFADAEDCFVHILGDPATCDYNTVHDCKGVAGLTYSGVGSINGLTPTYAVRIAAGTGTKVHVNTFPAGIVESGAADYSRVNDNTLTAGTVTLVGANSTTTATRTLFLAAAEGTNDGGATLGTVGTFPGKTACTALPDAADTGVTWTKAMPVDLMAGVPTAVIVWQAGAIDANNIAVRLNALALGAGVDPTAAGTTTTLTMPAGSSTNVQRTTITFPISLSPGAEYRIEIGRAGSTDAANDTATCNFRVIGLELRYPSAN